MGIGGRRELQREGEGDKGEGGRRRNKGACLFTDMAKRKENRSGIKEREMGGIISAKWVEEKE